MIDDRDPRLERIGHTVKKIHALLARKPADVQGAILADCLAIYLAGHSIVGRPKETADMRRQILEMHIEVVKELIPVNAKIMGTDR